MSKTVAFPVVRWGALPARYGNHWEPDSGACRVFWLGDQQLELLTTDTGRFDKGLHHKKALICTVFWFFLKVDLKNNILLDMYSTPSFQLTGSIFPIKITGVVHAPPSSGCHMQPVVVLRRLRSVEIATKYGYASTVLQPKLQRNDCRFLWENKVVPFFFFYCKSNFMFSRCQKKDGRFRNGFWSQKVNQFGSNKTAPATSWGLGGRRPAVRWVPRGRHASVGRRWSSRSRFCLPGPRRCRREWPGSAWNVFFFFFFFFFRIFGLDLFCVFC